ncbi:MAG: hypothetical protein ACXIT4_03270 [Erythrobacter sp.]
MMDIDAHLARLGQMPVPDLGGLSGADLADQARAEARTARMATSLAVAAALFIGVAGGLQTAPRSETAQVPFGASDALNPVMRLARR